MIATNAALSQTENRRAARRNLHTLYAKIRRYQYEKNIRRIAEALERIAASMEAER